MDCVVVAAGSYKAFYLNKFRSIKTCDLLVLNFGVLYDFVLAEEKDRYPTVIAEVFALSKQLNCVVVAGLAADIFGEKNDAILFCDGEKIVIKDARLGGFFISQKEGVLVEVGELYSTKKSALYNKIIISKRRIKPNLKYCKINKIYLFCDKFGVSLVKNKKIIRKFIKFSKFTLK